MKYNISIGEYSKALDLLDDYDHQRITKPKGREVIAYLSEEDCRVLIEKTKFSKQSYLFGKERDEGMLRGILNQIKQNIYHTFLQLQTQHLILHYNH